MQSTRFILLPVILLAASCEKCRSTEPGSTAHDITVEIAGADVLGSASPVVVSATHDGSFVVGISAEIDGLVGTTRARVTLRPTILSDASVSDPAAKPATGVVDDVTVTLQPVAGEDAARSGTAFLVWPQKGGVVLTVSVADRVESTVLDIRIP